MIFLDHLCLASEEQETDFFWRQKRTCYDTYYPFGIFPQKGFERIDFSDVTILYGGNGSGKSTLLNVLANMLGAKHDAVYNRSNFFEPYIELCSLGMEDDSYTNKEMLTSDGVFDCMLDIRNLNQAIDYKREEAFEEYMHLKSLNDYDPTVREELAELRRHPMDEKYRKRNMANTKTQSQYVRRTVVDNVREQSNGESAFEYFVHKIDQDGIYLLDEPENSLSPLKQQELVMFLEDSVRYFNCQLVIATHSPFLLSLECAKIYDLDTYPVTTRKWTQLPNVRAYYDFFKKHDKELTEETKIEEDRQTFPGNPSKMRNVLQEVLLAYHVPEPVMNDISFCLKSDKQIIDFIDAVSSSVPAGIGIKALTERLYGIAEGIKE